MATPTGTSPNDPQRPSRLEAEVAEILARSEQPVSFTEHVRRKADAKMAQARPTPQLPALNQLGPGSFLIGAFGFALLGAIITGVSPLLATLCGLVSVVSLAMVWIRRTPPGINQRKMWRGRELDPSPTTPPWLNDLRDRWQKPPRR